MKGAQKRIFYGIVLLSMLLSALYLALRCGAARGWRRSSLTAGET